ncbi:general stress protein 17M [Sporosarcina sp. NCCP-2716]|uniref:general stress protein n=1 Tax=Sporosarcina sp. NCCP-2716 TaxID=2943679 RepID=UPI00203E96DD|nr:general stress protein [Sporosarcina sp. NCCP-2716]GKV69493.1 general stress protein 17M [Sporosarcina sp. NCCP-2716]
MVEKFFVENAVQAKEKVDELTAKGYSTDDIYIFAHDKRRGENINDALDTEEAGMKEQGFLNSMKNMFSSRGDELRSKMHGAGLSEEDAATAESELDKGKLVVIANKK